MAAQLSLSDRQYVHGRLSPLGVYLDAAAPPSCIGAPLAVVAAESAILASADVRSVAKPPASAATVKYTCVPPAEAATPPKWMRLGVMAIAADMSARTPLSSAPSDAVQLGVHDAMASGMNAASTSSRS